MAKPAADDAYIALSATSSSDDGISDVNFRDDGRDGPVPEIEDGGVGGGPGVIAAQSLDLEMEQDRHEALGRKRSMRLRMVAAACLLAASALAGREYYARNSEGGRLAGSGPDGRGPNGVPNGVRGSPGGLGSDDLFGGVDEEHEEGVILDLVQGPGEEDGGVEEYEGDLDDEITNGEAERDFDSEEEIYRDSDGEEAASSGEIFEGEGAEDGVGDEGEEGPPFQERGELPEDDLEGGEAAGEDESTVGEEVENEEVQNVAHEELVQEARQKDQDEVHEDPGKEEQEEPPDYFVPLTPAERGRYKEKLRNTLRDTKAALLFAASGGAYGTPRPQRTLALGLDSPKQFMHMHHMKTGGTSVDGLISCALGRQRDIHNGTRLNYSRMSECGSTVKRCMNNLADKLNATVVGNVFYRNDREGAAQVDPRFSFDPANDAEENKELNVCSTSQADVMSYCASLHAVRTFGWGGADKITVIRDPVHRAWSMYRFTLNRCYDCEQMKDVLKKVGNGTFVARRRRSRINGGPSFVYDPNDSCAVQLIGHQATNLLSSTGLYNVANNVHFPREMEVVAEAVRNLREDFTWIGLTDRIQESVEGFRAVFPFLAENLNEAAQDIDGAFLGGGDDSRPLLPGGYHDKEGCPFQHRNAGRAPTCGTKELDDETKGLIKRLSNRDVAVYKAAVERFELQQEVLTEYRAGGL